MAVSVDALGETVGRPLTNDDVEPVNWAQAEYAEQLSASSTRMALAAVGQYRRHVQQWWADGWDLLLTPTLAAPPLPIGGLYGDRDDGVVRPTRWPRRSGPASSSRSRRSSTPRATRDQPAAALERRRAADRRPARGRLRPRGPADPRRQPTRARRPLGGSTPRSRCPERSASPPHVAHRGIDGGSRMPLRALNRRVLDLPIGGVSRHATTLGDVTAGGPVLLFLRHFG